MAVITKRDSGRWQAKVRRLGQPAQSKTFATKADAEAWARSIERAMDTDSFIPSNAAARLTFEKAAARYREEVLPRLRGKIQTGHLLARLVEVFGQYSLASISPAQLSAYRDDRLRAVSAQTVVHELGMISRIFKVASVDWGVALPKGNPVSLVRKPSPGGERERRLNGDEEALLLAALKNRESPWPHAAAVLAIETAGRQSELIALRWSDVDLSRRVARLRGRDGGITKNGDEWRDVPLSSVAVALLKKLPRSTSGKVLPISQNALKIAWGRSLRAARKAYVYDTLRASLAAEGMDSEAQGREVRAVEFKKREPLALTYELLAKLETEDKTLLDLHFHDLRHEATSRLAEKLQMHELMKVTGHKTSRMISRYYHPRAEDLAKKLD
jgi:integrase